MKLLIILMTLIYSSVAYPDSVFVKISVDGNSHITINYKNIEDINLADKRIKFIAKMIRENFFDINQISKDYYNIVTRDGIKIYNKLLKQIELTPIKNDRFSHIITVQGNLIVRREVYDTKNNLLYAYGFTDYIPDIQPTPVPVDSKDVSLEKDNIFYKGFKGKLIKKLEDGTIHYIFSDGLNKFSIFIKKNEKSNNMVKTIAYGNYLLSKNVDSIQYTLIGTIPFEEMENFITHITTKEKYIK